MSGEADGVAGVGVKSLLSRISGRGRDERTAGHDPGPSFPSDAPAGPIERAPAPGGTGVGAGDKDDEVDAGEPPEALAYLFDEAIITDGSDTDAGVESGTALVELVSDGAIDLSGPDSVRAVLARKLSRMLPNLSGERRDKVYDLTVRALERLARDHAVIVREALSSAIKDVACAPPSVCNQLARDIEQSVAEPILHYCATLTDSDLLSIISGQPPAWTLSAIARRPRVSPPVSVAIYESGNLASTEVLLDNHGAEIPESTLISIAEQSRTQTEWQGKLVRRLLLPRRVALRLAEFVDQTALEYLRGRRDFDSVTTREIVAVARRRIDWMQSTESGETPLGRAQRLMQQGKLDEAAVDDALSWNQGEFVIAALALRTNLPPPLVERIVRSRSGRAVTALAWRAGFTMRTALHLQKHLAGVPSSQLVYARDGTDFPLSPAEMTWQLEFFGIPPGH
jgi:uncharacterized protein (DUF2336 family)